MGVFGNCSILQLFEYINMDQADTSMIASGINNQLLNLLGGFYGTKDHAY